MLENLITIVSRLSGPRRLRAVKSPPAQRVVDLSAIHGETKEPLAPWRERVDALCLPVIDGAPNTRIPLWETSCGEYGIVLTRRLHYSSPFRSITKGCPPRGGSLWSIEETRFPRWRSFKFPSCKLLAARKPRSCVQKGRQKCGAVLAVPETRADRSECRLKCQYQ